MSISGFCESDQKYVKEWDMANELIDEKNLRISAADEVFGSREEEIAVSVSYGYGSIEEEKGGEQEYEDIGHIITFLNKSAYPIEDARIEYRIYYEQTARESKDPVQRIFTGGNRLPVIGPEQKVTFKTETVEILQERFTARYMSRYPADGDVHGIRCRLIVKLSEDQILIREFSQPSGLSEKKYPWTN